jgi:ABC-type transporter Mla MlaB component
LILKEHWFEEFRRAFGNRFRPGLIFPGHVDCSITHRGDQVTAMLRITVVESSRSAVTLRVEGRITGSSVEELRTACDVHTSADEVQLCLELADVSFADAAGIVLLKELGSRGVGLMHANPFMAEQLKEGASFEKT